MPFAVRGRHCSALPCARSYVEVLRTSSSDVLRMTPRLECELRRGESLAGYQALKKAFKAASMRRYCAGLRGCGSVQRDGGADDAPRNPLRLHSRPNLAGRIVARAVATGGS